VGSQEAIERGIVLFQELVGEVPELEEEFESSQRVFLPLPGQAAGALALRRHLEWFLFERPSNHLGGVPAEVLWERWREQAGPEEPERADTFLRNVAGVFEITSSDGGGVWIQDLFALGEYWVDEPEGANEFRPGDLLVGRLFPAGDGVFRLSPAAMCFRDERLAQAMREDLSRMRLQRRGVLRIQQIELERLFFTPRETAVARGRALDPSFLEEAERGLVGAGLDADEARSSIERVLGGSSGTVVTEVLNELAFTTDVELEAARRVLVDIWAGRPTGAAEDRRDHPSEGDVREALAAFDRGRAEGKDLEELFATLALDLGVGNLDDEEEDAGIADFPDVVSAMVEEFLWDVEHEEGQEEAESLAPVRLFGRFARACTVFENLGSRDVLDYCARWLLDESGLQDSKELGAAITAFARFCMWCEERHGLALATALAPFREKLLDSVPRLARVRPWLVKKGEQDQVFEVLRVESPVVELRPLVGGTTGRRVDVEFLASLRCGDIVRGSLQGDRLLASGVYPAEVREMAVGTGDSD